MLNYSDGARLGMCIGQVKEDWRHVNKKLISENVDEFITDVLFFMGVTLKIEQRITEPVVKPNLVKLNITNPVTRITPNQDALKESGMVINPDKERTITVNGNALRFTPNGVTNV